MQKVNCLDCIVRLLVFIPALWLVTASCMAQVSLSEVSGQWRSGYLLENQVIKDNCIAIEWVEQVVGFMPVPSRPMEWRGLWERTAHWVWADPERARRAGCRWSIDQDFLPTAEAFGRQAITARLNPTSGDIAVHLRFIDCARPLCGRLLQQSGIGMQDSVSADRGQDFVLRYAGNRLLTGPSDGVRPVELHRTADVAEDIERLEQFTDTLRTELSTGDFKAVRSHLARESASLSDGMLTRLQQEMAKATSIFSRSHVMTFNLTPATNERRIVAVLSSSVGNEDYSTYHEVVFLEWQDQSWRLLRWLHE